MGFLKKSDKEIWAKEEISKYDNELKPILGSSGMANLKATVTSIAEDQGFEEALAYIEYTRGRINYYNNKKNDYLVEAKLADGVYKSYITDGISRLEKINGRFMAAQNMKLDLIIEQNNRIIQLLEKIAGESNGFDHNFSNGGLLKNTVDEGSDRDLFNEENFYCPSCNSKIDKDSSFCTYCGADLNDNK